MPTKTKKLYNKLFQEEDETNKEFAKLLSKNTKTLPKIGELIEGKVISASNSEVLVDVNGLTVGVVRGYELQDESGETKDIKPGDIISATVIDLDNEKNQVELSFRATGHKKAWEKLAEYAKDKTVVDAVVTEANKGGLMVKVGGVRGFLPVSQLSSEHYPRVEGGSKTKILERLQELIGKTLKVEILDAVEEEEKLIVSEKETVKEEQEKIVSKYKVGDIVKGKISGVVSFGAFVEFDDGLEGLIHISEIAWKRIDDPNEYLKVGDIVTAKIIDINDSKISLSMKQLDKDPWKNVEEKYKVGQKVKGKILKTNPFGAFVELDKEIHGLAHISELSKGIVRDINEVVEIGKTYDFKIVSIDAKNHRLGLSIKALYEDEKKTKKGLDTSKEKEIEKKVEKPKKEIDKKEK
ncbi:MAG TPA: S1 RNA-binding domain-containing protein [bacterium]|nr:S1 RNA-binding domain-containing protein [bacterium]